MHPSIVEDHPGDCPICSMKLVPMAAETAARAHGAAHVEGAPAPRAALAAASRDGIAIAPDHQKLLGMTVATVREGAGTRTLRLLGRVAPDDKRLYRVNAGIEGSIRDLGPATAGAFVKKDEVLGSFYAPGALSVVQLFVLNSGVKHAAVPGRAQPPDDGEGGPSLAKANLQQRLMQLENYGVSARQREEIARAGHVPDAIWIVAPTDGFVLARSATVGMKFNRGDELFRIADLRRVWVVADVFPGDARHVRAGMKATVSVPEQGISLRTTIAGILPQFDGATRTLKVRLELDNPGHVLRPDMFVEVALPVKLPPGVAIPADAIVDSGLAKTVFVETGDGAFEPRRVETGWRAGDQVEIVKGLSPGDRIVTSGTFFLDSETRLRPQPSGAAVEDRAAPDPTGPARRNDGGAGLPSAPPAEARPDPRTHAHAGALP
ncbi:MAG TPA: efflux RND transporter periplasmic adaptor subunit [Anaeromyxobacter sp.]|nr:efflux RND transporter periplasmic adaptor subunit [Anaeromyxobacter sp.]